MAWRSAVPAAAELPVLRGPDGDSYRVDDPGASRALTRAFGQPLTLRVFATTTSAASTWSAPPRSVASSSCPAVGSTPGG